MKLSDNPILLLDADIPAYAAASACEKDLVVMTADGNKMGHKFYFNETRGHLLIDQYMQRLNDKFTPSSIISILSSADKDANYRYRVKGAYKEYKATRKPRPYHHRNMRFYFMDKYNAEIYEFGEADDKIGMIAYEKYIAAVEYGSKFRYCIVSTDKDFNQFPGPIFNPMNGKLTFSDMFGYLNLVNPKKLLGRGFKFFCAQMLMGDSADNILGVRGIGPRKCYKYLRGMSTYRGAWQRVVAVYKHHGVSISELKANASLLWITHEEGRRLPHHHLIEELL